MQLNGKKGEDYLISMLTTNADNIFNSPYNKELDQQKAQQLTKNFIDALSQQQSIEIYKMNTDYMYNRQDKPSGKKVMTYFEGGFGSDSSTLLIREDNKAFLLLTNGLD